MTNTNEHNTLDRRILHRRRLSETLEKACGFPLIFVIAGAGYGKTEAVAAFLREKGAVAAWVQLSPLDSAGSHFWEKYVKAVAQVNKPLADLMREQGFPRDNLAYEEMDAEAAEFQTTPRRYVVFDDFHLVDDGETLDFLEHHMLYPPKDTTFIVISRAEPRLSLFELASQKAAFVTDDTLLFTADEIADFMRQRGLPNDTKLFRIVSDETKGWALGINYLVHALGGSASGINRAILALRSNVVNIFEDKLSSDVSPEFRKLLIKLSMLDYLSGELIRLIASDGGADTASLQEDLRALSGFIRYDSFNGAYIIHSLFLSYLRTKADQLDPAEARSAYGIAANWCKENGLKLDALAYYGKAGDLVSTVRLIRDFGMGLPLDIASAAADIFAQAPPDEVAKIPSLPAMHINCLESVARLGEAMEWARTYEKACLAMPDSPVKFRNLCGIYGCIGFLRIMQSVEDDTYDFPGWFEKQHEYHAKNPYPTVGPMHDKNIGAWEIGIDTDREGAAEEYINAVASYETLYMEANDGGMAGETDLARAELHYYRGEYAKAITMTAKALKAALKHGQYHIAHLALHYRMLSQFSVGNAEELLQTLAEMDKLLAYDDYNGRYEAYDNALARYHLYTEHTDRIATRLTSDFAADHHPMFPSAAENMTRARYFFTQGDFETMFEYTKSVPGRVFVTFGRVECKVLEACAHMRTHRRPDALKCLREAYEIALPHGIIAPFHQMGNDIIVLLNNAIRTESFTVPKDFLLKAKLGAKHFANNRDEIIIALSSARGGKPTVRLTPREISVLRGKRDELSRDEIAKAEGISVATVKKALSSAYYKLDATSGGEAVLKALQMGLI